MLPVTQRGESHAAVFVHMFASPCDVFFLKQVLARFRTPIHSVPENNALKSVVILKVATFGAFRINPSLPSQQLTNAGRQAVREDRRRLL